MKDILSLQKVIFGHELIFHNVIITPLGSTYENIVNKFSGRIVEYKGMYKNCIIADKIHLIKVPQGIQAQDVMITLRGKKIMFVGFVGGFKDFKVGEVVSVRETVLPTGERSTLNVLEGWKTAVCGYSPALLGKISVEYQNKAKQMNCDIVDMEIAYCAYEKKDNLLSALMLVTDQPGICDFWDVDEKNQENYAVGKRKWLTAVYEYIEKMIID